MITEEQRIAIATACGFKLGCYQCFVCRQNVEWHSADVSGAGYHMPSGGCGGKLKSPPDYLNDLNTRGEMLEVLVDANLAGKFAKLFIDRWDALKVPQPTFCEKFLRTIGKWTD